MPYTPQFKSELPWWEANKPTEQGPFNLHTIELGFVVDEDEFE